MFNIIHSFKPSSANLSTSKTQKTGKHSDLETILYDWFAAARSQNIPITERILVEKGQQIGDQLQITRFAYSSGWISNFKKPFGINSKFLCGESGSSIVSVVASGTEAARAAMNSLKDVYNCDETGLFYRMLPSKSLPRINQHQSPQFAPKYNFGSATVRCRYYRDL